jgi:hypothetical protein
MVSIKILPEAGTSTEASMDLGPDGFEAGVIQTDPNTSLSY